MVTNHEHGGYQMDDNEIGMFVMIVAIVALFYQVKIYDVKSRSYISFLAYNISKDGLVVRISSLDEN